MSEIVSNPKITVTGGAGFIGSYVVQQLVQAGYKVRVVELPHVSLAHLPLQQIELLEGDLCNPQFSKQAAQDTEVIIHLAANAQLWAKNIQQFEQVNHQATKYLLDAAKSTVKKFIYVSSESTLISTQTQVVINEQTTTEKQDLLGPYCLSKWQGGQAVRDAQTDHMQALIAYPSIPIGCGDRNLGPFANMILDFAQGNIKGYLPGFLNLIDVRDVAAGLVKLATTRVKSQDYILAHQNWKVIDLFTTLARELDCAVPRWRAPYWLAYAFAWLEEQICVMGLKQRPIATVTGIRLAKYSVPIDAQQTWETLQLQLHPCLPVLQAMVQWLVENYLPDCSDTSNYQGSSPPSNR